MVFGHFDCFCWFSIGFARLRSFPAVSVIFDIFRKFWVLSIIFSRFFLSFLAVCGRFGRLWSFSVIFRRFRSVVLFREAICFWLLSVGFDPGSDCRKSFVFAYFG